VLVQAYSPSLTLFPESTWAGVEGRMLEMMRHPEHRPRVLKALAGMQEVSADNQGRILIPVNLRSAANLQGEVMLLGAIDRIELWDPETFASEVEVDTGEFAKFAPQIFR
jgi:MraZ protein